MSSDLKLLVDKIDDATRAQSRVCAMNPRMRRRVLKCALAVWPMQSTKDNYVPKTTLLSDTRRYYKKIYGINPLILWFLGIVIEVVIRMLIEWWKKFLDKRLGLMRCATVCRAAGSNLDKCF